MVPMLTHGKRADPGFLLLAQGGFLPASHQKSLCFSGGSWMTLKRSLTANKNVLDIRDKSGMIEVIDSRTK
jgi:hypothetical protein